MLARSHSGRRARSAGGFDETGVGMDVAIGVTGVSGINSAMMEKPFQRAVQMERPRYAIYFPARHIQQCTILAPFCSNHTLVAKFAIALPYRRQTPRRPRPPPAARPRRVARRCRANAPARSRP